ncbi:MAG: hypothetical protein WBN40_00460, partial [Pseudomonadales bacterium]
VLLSARSLFLVLLVLFAPNVHAFQYEDFDNNQIPATDWDQQDRAAIFAGFGSYATWSTQADPLNPGGYLYRIESDTSGNPALYPHRLSLERLVTLRAMLPMEY